jgi:hypothetical protein
VAANSTNPIFKLSIALAGLASGRKGERNAAAREEKTIPELERATAGMIDEEHRKGKHGDCISQDADC